MGNQPPIARLNEPGRDRTTEPGTIGHRQARPHRRLIKLSVAEARRLFNVRHQGKHAMQQALAWSIWRREHQAEARRHHFRRRLNLQQVLSL